MSLITLFNSEHLTLLSSQRIYHVDEVGGLKSVAEKVREIDQTLTTARTNIDKAASNASDEGYKAGFESGKSEGVKVAHREAAEKRLAEHHRGLLEDKVIREQSIELALDIVRHIGMDTGVPQTLHLLAEKVAQSLRPDESVTISVHPDVQPSIEKLCTRSDVSVVADESLLQQNCLLQWKDGSSVEADLETQLSVIKNHLLQAD